ncbi:uncharacterized protein HNQ59_001227 [Chitinivorax tropicus]|uniref:DUF418 domain-containing protein n=1 Tax=Chitinivorax tropicus TaxID=714531 RepID=A0A840MMJ3_9PROT|nr:DUF418 domain-containing protein [Chitinivorax tropicus]MBB5017942.1 uncharacterized protein [Chitinivorax tropicus]
MDKPFKPIATEQRIALLDCVRGFSLAGICLANLVSFAGLYVMTADQILALPWPVADRIALFLIDCFIEGKFYTLFSLLFGIGFGLQSARAAHHPRSFAVFWLRRMAVLCMFGLIHMFVIWYGDILTLYSLMGLMLLAFRNTSSAWLLRWVGILLLMPLLIQLVWFQTTDHPFWQSLAVVKTRLQAQWGYMGWTLFDMRSSNHVVDILASNVLNAVTRPMAYLQSGRPFQVLGQFLLGYWLAREILPRLPDLHPTLNKLAWPTAIIGLSCSAIYALIKAQTGLPQSTGLVGLAQSLVYHLGCTTLALYYLILIERGSRSTAWQSRLQWLQPLGRVPLTNYIGQSCIALWVFYGYGLAWMGRLPFVALIPLMVAIILLQRTASHQWLRHQPQGPLERLWRAFSYPRPLFAQP